MVSTHPVAVAVLRPWSQIAARQIALAERAHRTAFPECPVLGFDIVRDVETGELFVLESHTQGSWLVSGNVGRKMEADNQVDFEGQFGAFEKAAGILARVALALLHGCPFPLAQSF